jgi:hypothetical protein
LRKPRHWPALAGFTMITLLCAGMPLLAAYNRMGAPESMLELAPSEVELPSYDSKLSDNTPLSLRLLWNVESPDGSATVADTPSLRRVSWLNRQKLEQLKINAPIEGGSHLLVTTLLVLELEGAAYRREEALICPTSLSLVATTHCDRRGRLATRLYVIDAGRQLEELRKLYPDRTRYAIVHGTIKIVSNSAGGDVVGYIDGLSNETVQGPEPLRSAIDPADGSMLWHHLSTSHSFSVSVAFGRRLEPWISSVKY